MNWKIFTIAFIILSGLLYTLYNFGYKNGIVYAEQEFSIQSQKLENKYKIKIEEYQNDVSRLQSELQTAQIKFKEELAFINGDSSSRLLKSEQRASVYREQARDSEAKRRELAEHTARLDKALTEGTALVKELSELIKLRDTQVNTCTKLLLEERKLHGAK